MLGVGEVLRAEAATDIGGDEADIGWRNAEMARGGVAVAVDVLAGDVQRIAAVSVAPDGTAWLQRVRDDAVVFHVQRHDMRGGGEGGIDGGGIAPVPIHADIVWHFVGDTRRARRGG